MYKKLIRRTSSPFLAALALLSTQLCFANAASIETRVANADPQVGKQIAGRCTVCHHVQKGAGNKIGPNLWEVVDRKIGSMDGFNYSRDIKTKSGYWSYKTLDAFLTDPASFAPGTTMLLVGIDDAVMRANLIAYLRTLSDHPADLPEPSGASGTTKAVDPFGESWPAGNGREITGYTCSACHSLAIVKQQGQTHEGWDELIDWMIEEQGMSALSEEDRKAVVQYLGDNFNVD